MHTNTRRQLLAEIDPAMPTVIRRVDICGLQLDIVQPADPDSLLDERTLLDDHNQLRWQPYWAQAWDASFGLAEHLAELQLAGKSLLDLGCGLGLCGAVAAARGARVVLADSAEPAIPFARYNIWPWRQRAEVRLLNWRHHHIDRRFEVIVGADILYDREEIPYLDQFWRRHLAGAGTVLLGDPSRAMTRDLLDRLAQLGWQQSQSRRVSPGLKNPTRIVRMRLNSSD